MYSNKDVKNSFDTVYEMLYPMVFRIAYRIVGDPGIAEDVSQEAFIKYFQREEPLPDIDQTKYWLIRVVKNLSFNHEKKKTRERKMFSRLKEESPKFSESGDKEVLREETKNIVKEALLELPYNLRVVLVLKEYGQMNYKEIGAALGISEGNVKVRVFRGREKLAKLLEGRL
ncbi:MAG: RNA polymerase sigma factor [Spirochaetales bacterium]|nr:RNA polymerase sigma factor [Spirochaetales bacterium]